MGLRSFVVRWFGENAARRIEQFVEVDIFGDTMLTCPTCRTPVCASIIKEWGMCPICRTKATNDLTIEALEARRRAAVAAGMEAIEEVEEIDRELLARRKNS